MKKLVTLLFIAGMVLSCTTSPDPAVAEAEEAKAAAKAKAEEHLAVVKKYLGAFESGDFEIWREICADDFITYGPGYHSEGSLDGYIKSMAGMTGKWDSLKITTIGLLPYTLEEGERAGDYVFWWGTNSAYFIEAEKRATLMIHTVFKMKDGKIHWEADYWDTGDMKKQLTADEPKKEKEL